MSGLSSSSPEQPAQQAFPTLHYPVPGLDASQQRIASEPCPHPRCNQIFTGASRKGNMLRHIRTKHGAPGTCARKYLCTSVGCGKTFKRKDARLNHERKVHPELGRTSEVPRKPLDSKP